MMSHDAMIEVISAHKAGKTIQYRHISWTKDKGWQDNPVHLVAGPNFDFMDFEYRVKPEPREFWVFISGDHRGEMYPVAQIGFDGQRLPHQIRVREVPESGQ